MPTSERETDRTWSVWVCSVCDEIVMRAGVNGRCAGSLTEGTAHEDVAMRPAVVRESVTLPNEREQRPAEDAWMLEALEDFSKVLWPATGTPQPTDWDERIQAILTVLRAAKGSKVALEESEAQRASLEAALREKEDWLYGILTHGRCEAKMKYGRCWLPANHSEQHAAAPIDNGGVLKWSRAALVAAPSQAEGEKRSP